jgi:hypothetical protein
MSPSTLENKSLFTVRLELGGIAEVGVIAASEEEAKRKAKENFEVEFAARSSDPLIVYWHHSPPIKTVLECFTVTKENLCATR